jgi:septal ring factor EnvC (AmiA/AmiB activator)
VLQPSTAQALAATLQDTKQSHDAMDRCVSNMATLLAKIDAAIKTHNTRMTALLDQLKRAGQSQLLDATKQMQETQMSFNLQYLQLQSQMQHENRSYTAISNIMKTKHDTVKNSISNVR